MPSVASVHCSCGCEGQRVIVSSRIILIVLYEAQLCSRKLITLFCFSQRTPLHYSASGGQLEICRLLLQCNADVNAKDRGYLLQPLSFLQRYSFAQVDYFFVTIRRYTPLHVSAREGRLDTCRLLVESKADVAAENKCFSFPPLAIFHSQYAFQLWQHCSPTGHGRQQS
jgi:ankyrin repeat protein